MRRGSRDVSGEKRTGPARAGAAIEQAVRGQLAGVAGDHLATAQARIGWDEVLRDTGLARAGTAVLVRVVAGTAWVETDDSLLAQELLLRRDSLLRALASRTRGRPGARVVVELRVSVTRRTR